MRSEEIQYDRSSEAGAGVASAGDGVEYRDSTSKNSTESSGESRADPQAELAREVAHRGSTAVGRRQDPRVGARVSR